MGLSKIATNYSNSSTVQSNLVLLGLVGSYIRYYKRVNGVGDTELSKRIGCSSKAVYNLQTGRTEYCSISFVSRIAEAFGFDFVGLVDEARRVGG